MKIVKLLLYVKTKLSCHQKCIFLTIITKYVLDNTLIFVNLCVDITILRRIYSYSNTFLISNWAVHLRLQHLGSHLPFSAHHENQVIICIALLNLCLYYGWFLKKAKEAGNKFVHFNDSLYPKWQNFAAFFLATFLSNKEIVNLLKNSWRIGDYATTSTKWFKNWCN